MLSITYGIEWLPPETAFGALHQKDFGAIVLSFPAIGWTPCELLEAVQRLAPSIPVLIRDPRASVFDAVRLARLGVYQFLASGDEATAQIEQAIEERRTHDLARLAEQVGREEWERLLIGDSREMRRVGHIIRLVGVVQGVGQDHLDRGRVAGAAVRAAGRPSQIGRAHV